MSLVLDEHREYLSDTARLAVFDRALKAVASGAVVVDIGTGTGILGLLACKAGASRVYAIEKTAMVEIARALAAANGFSDRFHVIKEHSTEVILPERADVVVGDFVGRFGFNAGIFDVYPSAASAFLKPGGVLVPSEIAMFVAPVETAAMAEQMRFWDGERQGIRLTPIIEWALNTGYPVTFAAADLLGDGIEIGRASTAVVPPNGFTADIELPIRRRGTLHGWAGWFDAQLAPGVIMTNEPGAPHRITRRNVFFPIRQPLDVSPDDRVRARIRILPRELIVKWTVEVTSASGDLRTRSAHSTVSGWLLASEDLQRTQPDFKPALTPRGVARLTLLQLCDGSRPLHEIERVVYERHSQIFESPAEAAAFVAEVTSGYAKL